MDTLDRLLHDRPSLSLDDVTTVANEVLAEMVPDQPTDARVKAEVNARLIRHYVGEKMIDPAVRSGRHVVYGVDQLLQLLALRRLLVDGVPSASIGRKLRRLDRDLLRAIAEGRATLDDAVVHSSSVVSSGEWEDEQASPPYPVAFSMPRESLDAPAPPYERESAVDVLNAIRARSRMTSAPPADKRSLARTSSVSTPDVRTWERVTLMDGIELHVRDDVSLPQSSLSQRTMLDRIVHAIVMYAQTKRP